MNKKSMLDPHLYFFICIASSRASATKTLEMAFRHSEKFKVAYSSVFATLHYNSNIIMMKVLFSIGFQATEVTIAAIPAFFCF